MLKSLGWISMLALTGLVGAAVLWAAEAAREGEPPPRPPGPPEKRGPGPRGPVAAAAPSPPPTAKSDEEKKILEVLDDMFRNQRQGMMNVPPDDGRLLRVLVEALGAKTVVEIGTSNGYSGTWICLGLRATGGKLITHEIDAGRAKLARENFKRAGVESIVTLVEGDAHKEVAKLKDPIDIIFIDADKEGYVDYLQKLLPLVRPGGLILAHNIASHERDLQDYLKAVTTSPDLETVSANTRSSGIGVTLKKR
ncbi:MAG: O-methyltransferase [Planctomycetes bacterium]|nr:O-methyltransferase [Planctomycetota bacterium]